MTRLEQKQARLLAGLSQAELAAQIGVVQATVSRWEQKESAPVWLRTWWRGFFANPDRQTPAQGS